MENKQLFIGNWCINAPETNEPETGTNYYMPNILYIGAHDSNAATKDIWHGAPDDIRRLERGLVHLTRQDAINHAMALLGLTRS